MIAYFLLLTAITCNPFQGSSYLQLISLLSWYKGCSVTTSRFNDCLSVASKEKGEVWCNHFFCPIRDLIRNTWQTTESPWINRKMFKHRSTVFQQEGRSHIYLFEEEHFVLRLVTTAWFCDITTNFEINLGQVSFICQCTVDTKRWTASECSQVYLNHSSMFKIMLYSSQTLICEHLHCM